MSARQRSSRAISRWLAVASALVWVVAASAQTPRNTGTIVLHAGRVFDSEQGTFSGPQDIIVQRSRITAIGPKLAVPAGATEIDLRRYTILPGLVDSHTHLLFLEGPSGLLGESINAVVVEGTPLRALHGAARARTYLAAGITSVRDLGNSGRFGDVALKAAIRDGSVDGPRMYVSGPGLSPEGGQFPKLQSTYKAIAEEEYRVVRGPVDASMAVRENVTYGADVIKIYSNNSPNNTSLSLEEMQAIVAEAKRLGVTVAAHATSDAAVYRAALAGVTSVEHAYEVADSTLAFMTKHGVVLVPTDGDSLSYALHAQHDPPGQPKPWNDYLTSTRTRLRRAMHAGVPIVSGSDQYAVSDLPQGEAARQVLFGYAEAGMPNVQVLQTATINPARMLGRTNDFGVLKPGRFADIIAVDGDPGTDINALKRIQLVMKEGTIYVWKH